MSVLIKDIQRNNKEIIRIEVSEFKGRELINIRIWYQSIDENGQITYKPTQKGVALNIKEFQELKDGIVRLEQYIMDRSDGAVPEQPVDIVSEETIEEPDDEEEKKETEE